MAKISAEEKARRKAELDEVVELIFWESGWEGITLDSVSKLSGVRRSTVQNYYPSKLHFGEALRGKSFPVVVNALDLSSPEEFKISWEVALRGNKRFRQVIHLLVSNSTSDSTNQMTVAGLVRLRVLLTNTWDSETKAIDALYYVLGLSVMKLAES